MRRRFLCWLNAKSHMFSLLCGEDFTHKDVLLAHVGLILFLLLMGVVGHFEQTGY